MSTDVRSFSALLSREFLTRLVRGLAIWTAAIVLLAGAGGLFAAQVTSLQVVSANIDMAVVTNGTHQLTVELLNTSLSKTVTAYMLKVEGLDAAGTPVPGEQDLHVGYDGVCYYPAAQRCDSLIEPGKTGKQHGLGLPLGTASARVTVEGVVYDDRSFEGPDSAVGSFFVGRANDTREARHAIAALTPYPATPEEVRALIQKLRSMPHGIALTVFANAIHLSGEEAGVLLDKQQPPPEVGVPSKQQWDEVAAELSRHAGILEAQSAEVRP